jgi:microcompartment protein CcmL/EutN
VEASSLGLIEIFGYVAAIEAADAGCKAANVDLLGYERGRAGLFTVKFAGDVAAVSTAVAAGSAAAEKIGKVVATHVIARPDRQLHAIYEDTKALLGSASNQIAVRPDVIETNVEVESETDAEESRSQEPVAIPPAHHECVTPNTAETQVTAVDLVLPIATEEQKSSAEPEDIESERSIKTASRDAGSLKSRRKERGHKGKEKKKF